MTTNSMPNSGTSRWRRFAGAALIVGAAAATAGTLASAAPASADAGGEYVVIAYSPDNGAHGWANNKATFQDAYDAAMAYCAQFGGGNCQLGAWDHGGCAAVVADTESKPRGPWAGRGGADLSGAEGAAVYANGGGQVVLSRCATGGQGAGT